MPDDNTRDNSLQDGVVGTETQTGDSGAQLVRKINENNAITLTENDPLVPQLGYSGLAWDADERVFRIDLDQGNLIEGTVDGVQQRERSAVVSDGLANLGVDPEILKNLNEESLYGNIHYVSDIETLRNGGYHLYYQAVFVAGARMHLGYAISPIYLWEETSQLTPNNTTVIRPEDNTLSSGRWVLLSAVAEAQGTGVYFLSSRLGNDDFLGVSPESPVATLQEAVARLSPGDVLCILPGRYELTEQLALPPGTTVVGVDSTQVLVAPASNSTLSFGESLLALTYGCRLGGISFAVYEGDYHCLKLHSSAATGELSTPIWVRSCSFVYVESSFQGEEQSAALTDVSPPQRVSLVYFAQEDLEADTAIGQERSNALVMSRCRCYARNSNGVEVQGLLSVFLEEHVSYYARRHLIAEGGAYLFCRGGTLQGGDRASLASGEAPVNTKISGEILNDSFENGTVTVDFTTAEEKAPDRGNAMQVTVANHPSGTPTQVATQRLSLVSSNDPDSSSPKWYTADLVTALSIDEQDLPGNPQLEVTFIRTSYIEYQHSVFFEIGVGSDPSLGSKQGYAGSFDFDTVHQRVNGGYVNEVILSGTTRAARQDWVRQTLEAYGTKAWVRNWVQTVALKDAQLLGTPMIAEDNSPAASQYWVSQRLDEYFIDAILIDDPSTELRPSIEFELNGNTVTEPIATEGWVQRYLADQGFAKEDSLDNYVRKDEVSDYAPEIVTTRFVLHVIHPDNGDANQEQTLDGETVPPERIFHSLQVAINEMERHRFFGEQAEGVIRIHAGIYLFTEPVVFSHSDGDKVSIIGDTPALHLHTLSVHTSLNAKDPALDHGKETPGKPENPPDSNSPVLSSQAGMYFLNVSQSDPRIGRIARLDEFPDADRLAKDATPYGERQLLDIEYNRQKIASHHPTVLKFNQSGLIFRSSLKKLDNVAIVRSTQ